MVSCFAGCGEATGVTAVEADDAEIHAAIQQARDSVGEFMARVSRPGPDDRDFAVKAPFAIAGGGNEHIWITDVSVRDGRLHGKVGNVPVGAVSVRLGDMVSFAKEEISDWMYVSGDLVVGSYTTRVLRSRMKEAERRRMDEGMGVRFE